MSLVIRAARPDDAVELQAIELEAGQQFRDIGMPEIAEDPPPTLQTFISYALGGRCWVAVDDAGTSIGFVIVDDIDGNAHIEQVSVRPDHQRTGVGRRLIDQVRTWATATNRPAMTLTTFKHVTWNAPLYRRLGFSDMTDEEIGPELRKLGDDEAAHGLDPTLRVCMRSAINP